MSESKYTVAYGFQGETWFVGIEPPFDNFMCLAVANLVSTDWQIDSDVTECTLYRNETNADIQSAQALASDIGKLLKQFGKTVFSRGTHKAINMDGMVSPFSDRPEYQPSS